MIEFDQVSKHFPGAQALDQVSFAVERGQCHALLGENGAGKSTLGKILAGIYSCDGGQVRIDGRAVCFHQPRDAVVAGVGIVHQELVFCPNLSVAENLCLHDLPRRGWRLDRAELRRRARQRLAEIELDLDVDAPVSELSIAQEQLVQIAAAVGTGARILVFDEPTSSLGPAEVRHLMALVRRLQEGGVTIIYVSHRLEEVFELCQSVTVLRDGRHVATGPVDQIDRDALVRMMVGRDVDAYSRRGATDQSASGQPARLVVRGLSSPGRFSDIDLDLPAGQIVGLAGLVGAGRSELATALYGLDDKVTGEICLDSQTAQLDSPADALRLGIALVPEDRKRQALVLDMNVRENLTLPILDRFRRVLGWADRRAESSLAVDYCRQLSVRTPDIETPCAALSGGNQQKIVLAKAVAAGTRVLIVDEPTRGVDVGAKREIHELIARLAADGAAVLMISSDLPELLALSDQVVVLRGGRVVARMPGDEASPEQVLRAMAGL